MKRAALILCAAISLPVHAKQEEMAFALFNKDYPVLLQLAKPLASKEDCGALYYLGRYFEEPHADKDLAQAASHYARVVANAQCAEQNLESRTQAQHAQEAVTGSVFLSASAAAAERMAALYDGGDTAPDADLSKAMHWWQVAENYGSHEAVYRLGRLHLTQGDYRRAIHYLHKHLELIKAAHAYNPWVQRIESRDTNYALGRLFLDSGSEFHDRDNALTHLREAAVLRSIEPSYLLALAYAQRDAGHPFKEMPGTAVSDDDIELAIAFLEPAVEREVAPPHLRLKRVQGQLLLADLLFRNRPARAHELMEAAAVGIGELTQPARQIASLELKRLKQKWGLD